MKTSNVTVMKRLWDWNWKMGQQSLRIFLFWYVRHLESTAQQQFFVCGWCLCEAGIKAPTELSLPSNSWKVMALIAICFNGWTPPLQGWTKLSHYNVIITKTEPITVNFWVILSPPWQWRQCHLPKKRNTWELYENAFRTQLQSLTVGRLVL